MRAELRVLRQHLAVNGLKLTRQRLTIVERFLASDGHLCAEELYRLLAEEGTPVSLATVYRTLKMLVSAGLASERHFPDGTARYETVFGEPQHDHLVCQQCHRIIEMENPFIARLYELASEQHDLLANGHRLVITGVCGDCRRQGA